MSSSYEERHGTEPTGDTGCEGLVPDPEAVEQDLADHGIEPDPDPFGRRRREAEDVASARHVEIKIDGLPGQLQPGHHAMTFSDMEYRAGSNRPVLRFRYAGRLADDARIMHQIEQVQRPPAEQAEAEGWLLPPAELPEVYRTRSGKIVTEAMIEAWVAEAERGYDFAPPMPQRQGLWHRREEEANQWPREMADRARAAQQAVNELGAGPPDLYQVSTVETLNVSKLARIITQLVHKGVLDPAEIGLVPEPGTNLTPGVEDWLRS